MFSWLCWGESLIRTYPAPRHNVDPSVDELSNWRAEEVKAGRQESHRSRRICTVPVEQLGHFPEHCQIFPRDDDENPTL